jgi:uncharacterized protein
MQRKIMMCIVVLALSLSIHAQVQPYKVVFDLTSKDSLVHQRVIRWVDGIVKSDASPEVEIVFYGLSLDMICKEKSTVSEAVTRLAKLGNVKFVACEHAMKVFNVPKDQLLPGVTSVADGIYEIIIKQAQGYGYIKVIP